MKKKLFSLCFPLVLSFNLKAMPCTNDPYFVYTTFNYQWASFSLSLTYILCLSLFLSQLHYVFLFIFLFYIFFVSLSHTYIFSFSSFFSRTHIISVFLSHTYIVSFFFFPSSLIFSLFCKKVLGNQCSDIYSPKYCIGLDKMFSLLSKNKTFFLIYWH